MVFNVHTPGPIHGQTLARTLYTMLHSIRTLLVITVINFIVQWDTPFSFTLSPILSVFECSQSDCITFLDHQ